MSAPETSPTTKLRRRRLAISVRVMMLLVLVVGLPMGWKARRASIQRRAIAAVERAGGGVLFDYQTDADKRGVARPISPLWPAWLRQAIGDEYFREVTGVWINPPLADRKNEPKNLDSLMESISGFDFLENFGIEDGWVTKPGIACLGRLHRLEHLVLEVKNLEDADLVPLRSLNGVRTLKIHNTPEGKNRFNGTGLVYLAGMTRMKELEIFGVIMDGPDVLAPLAGLTSLEELKLSKSPRDESCLRHLGGIGRIAKMDLDGTELGDAGIKDLANLESLAFLFMDGSKITDIGLIELARHPKLVTVEIKRLNRVTDDGLSNLLRVNQLQFLYLQHSSVNGSFLSNLPSGHPLWGLDLSDTAVTDAGLASIHVENQLRRLSLAGTKVTETGLNCLGVMKKLEILDLSRTSTTGFGLASVTKISSLRSINLAETGITDADLPLLYPLTRLINLDLTKTKVTPTGINAIRRQLPNLSVRVDGHDIDPIRAPKNPYPDGPL